MTKAAAIHKLYSSFGLKAYEESSVPSGDDAPEFPYLTYTLSTDSFGTEVPLSISLWYRGSSWVEANAKTEEISRIIGPIGITAVCDGGRLRLRRGTPFARSMSDPSDKMIKRKYINVIAEFITNN